MLTNNMDVTDGLTNGAVGTVTHVVSHDGSTTILGKFENACVTQAAKEKSTYKHITISSFPVKHYQAPFQTHGKKSAETSQTQVPLILSWPITIHEVPRLDTRCCSN